MTNSNQYPVTYENTAEHNSILLERDVLEERAYQCRKFRDGIYEAGDPTEIEKLFAANDIYEETWHEAQEKGEPLPSHTAFFQGVEGLPEGYVDSLILQDEIDALIAVKDAELEPFAPEKRIELDTALADIESRLNYNKLVEDYSIFSYSGLMNAASTILAARKILADNVPKSYKLLEDIESVKKSSALSLQEGGLLLDESAIAEHNSLNLPGSIEAVRAKVSRAQELHKRYSPRSRRPSSDRDYTEARQEAFFYHLDSATLAAQNYDFTISDVLRGNVNYNNAQMRAALGRQLTAQYGLLPSHKYELEIDTEAYRLLAAQAREIDVKVLLDGVEVAGIPKDSPFEFNTETLKNYLLSAVPPLAFINLKKITFRAIAPDETILDNAAGFYRRWSEELGGAEIVVTDRYFKLPETDWRGNPITYDQATLETTVKRNKSQLLNILAHEAAHALHDELPVAALQRWDTDASSHQYPVTPYVEDNWREDRGGKYMEDFAESLMLYANKPEHLDRVSWIRYMSMRDIYRELMPGHDFDMDMLEDSRSKLVQGIINKPETK
ncbi:hypothetical protein BH10PAT3_BH10PAT3_5930 [soil metagenome]